jgi:hypothetical protein
MARSKRELERLAAELASLTPEERSRVFAEAARRARWHGPPAGWTPPTLSGGGVWTGGSLRREDIYGDDGR